MKTIALIVLVCCLVAACGPTRSQLIQSAYDRGEISSEKYLTLMQQEQQRQDAVCMAIMGYGANMQQQANQDYYSRAALANQQQQMLQQGR